MKKILFIIFSLAITIFATLPIIAEDYDIPNSSFNRTPIKKEKEDDGLNRPKAPSNQCIFFAYDAANSNCIFTLPVDVEYIDIELTGTENQVVYIGSVDSLNTVWHQTLSSGEYYIVCTADNGDIYSGYIYI